VDYRPVTVVEQHIRALGYGRYEVTGTVRNDEATPITAIQVIAITGHVWSASLGASTLQPGATTTFSINMAFDLPDYYGPPPDYRLMAQGIRNP
jgi:hypothetical protein